MEGDLVGEAAGGQDLAVAVPDLATGSGQEVDAQAVPFRPLEVLLAAEDLEVYQSEADHRCRQGCHGDEGGKPPRDDSVHC
ncbi:hypothetical protein D3C87_1089550 [compost metagenome]